MVDLIVIRSFPAPAALPTGITFDGKYLWSTDNNSDLIYQQDIRNGTVIKSFATPAAATRGLACDGKYLWTMSDASDRVYQLEMKEGREVRSFVGFGSVNGGLAFDGKYLWQSSATVPGLAQIDPYGSIDPTPVIQTMNLPGGTGTIRAFTFIGGSRIVFSNTGDNLIYIIDVRTAKVLASFTPPGTSAYQLAFDGKFLWVTDFGVDRIFQLSLQ